MTLLKYIPTLPIPTTICVLSSSIIIYYGNVLQLIELQIPMISGSVREQGQLYRGRT